MSRVTRYVDDTVVEAAATKRRAAIVVLVFFSSLVVLNAYSLVMAAVSGDVADAIGPLMLLGLLTTPLLLTVAITVRWRTGPWLWVSFLVGGAIVALGPTIALIDVGWTGEVFFPGRWWTGGYGPLSDVAPLLWALSAIMMVPSTIMLLRTERRSASR